MMQQLASWAAVMDFVASARNDGLFVSNFFPDAQRMAAWCGEGKFFAVRRPDTLLLSRRQAMFSNVYFMSRSVGALADDFDALLPRLGGGRYIVDVIGPDASREPIERALAALGFSRLTTIQRMARKTPDETPMRSGGVVCATDADVSSVMKLLEENFLAEQEQLPTRDEIARRVEQKMVYVVRGGATGVLDGFAIFDLSPATLYLRYWFVAEAARGRGVGGALLKAMFCAAARTKRQYLWVKTDNVNAIKRYRHYGFNFEPLKDCVMALTSI